MALDPQIPLMVRPPEPIDPMSAMAKVLALNHMREQNATMAQEQQLRTQEMQMRTQEMQQWDLQIASTRRTQAGRDALTALLKDPANRNPDGEVNHEAVAKQLGEAGFDDIAEPWLAMTSKNREALDKLHASARAHADAAQEAIGSLAASATSAREFEAGLGMLASQNPPLIDEATAHKYAQEAEAAGPDGWKPLAAQYVHLAPSQRQAAMVTQAKLSEPMKVGENESVIIPGTTGTPQVVFQGAKKAPTAAELTKQELDAYAQSIGKTSSAQLTYAERRKYEADKEQQKSDISYTQHQRDRLFDVAHPMPPPPEKPTSQDKLEQEARTVLVRGMSSRSGGIGLEDAKVQQANHLLSLFEQTYNPKTGAYDIPRVQLNELALGLAKLTAGTSQAGEGMLREFQQRTAKGDIAGALTYLTGQPVKTNTDAITTFLKESIERQGRTAEQNREGELGYLRGLMPTGLEETRRQALEKTSLNPLRQHRIAKDAKGNTRLFVSTDGGETWK